jgi:hypothetical protein
LAGRPSTITERHVETARRIAEIGGALPTVANACKVPLRTVERWVEVAKKGTGSDLHDAFWRAIQEGHGNAEIRAIERITESQDPRDAQWWLTHHPTTRDTWSDAAAERRAVTAAMQPVIRAIAGLPPEQRQSLILAIRAEGGSLPEGEDEPDS